MEQKELLKAIEDLIVRKFDELKAAQKEFMTVSDVAEYLGIKPSYVYKMTHNREIPCYKPGGKMVYFKREDVDAWVLSNRVASADEIRSEARRRIRKL